MSKLDADQIYERMKRIICFTTSLSKGGAEKQLSILANMLAEKGYKVDLTTFSSSRDEYSLSPEVNRIRIRQEGSSIRKFIEIFKYFLNNKSDCVISFGARCNFLSILPMLFRRNIKIIAGERCATFNGMTWYKILNYRFLYKRANYIVPNNYTQKEEIANLYPYLDKKVHVVTNYTDLTQFVTKSQPNNEKVRVGIFGRYDKQKNYETLACALRILMEEVGPIFQVDWYGNKIIGAEENPDYVIFSKLIENYGIGEIITLHGHTDKVAELIPQFDVMCLPSLGEGFSNSIGEYICCGKPVLCSDVADNNVMVKDGINGFLFDPKNIRELVNAFKRFFSLSNQEKTEMGKQSRKIAEELFNKERFINSYIDLIEK